MNRIGVMSFTLHALVLAVATTMSARAQGRDVSTLETVKAVTCRFVTMSVGTWKAGEPAAEIKPAKLTLGFDAINVDDGTARVVGAFGPSEIIVKLSGGTLHFVQAFREGPLYATTIFSSGSGQGKLRAVHSRHEFTEVSVPGFTSRPEQYYGECEIRN